MLAATAAYLAVFRLGYVSTTLPERIAPVWLATGLGIWMVIRCGPRLLWVIALGEILGNSLEGVPIGGWRATVMLGVMGAGNVLTAAVGARIWLHAQQRWRERCGIYTEACATFATAFLPPLAGASVGVLALSTFGATPPEKFGRYWFDWWISDSVGTLFMLPLLLAAQIFRGALAGDRRRLMVRAGAVLVLTGISAWTAFLSSFTGLFLFAIFPVILLATVWLGGFGAHATANLFGAIGTLAAAFGYGPLVTGQLRTDLILVQLLLISVGLVALLLPALHEQLNLLRRRPLILLSIGWLLSAGLFIQSERHQAADEAALFQQLSQEAENVLRKNTEVYLNALSTGAGVLAALPEMDRSRWNTFAEKSNIQWQYPGIKALAVVYPVAPAAVNDFLERRRAEGPRGFSIRPVPGHGDPASDRERYVVTYLVPEGENQSALGLDLASDPRRRTAAEAARDTGEVRMTQPISLVQAPQDPVGFIIFRPVYRAGASLATVADRRAAFLAWVDAPFLATEFFEYSLGARNGQVRLQVFAGGSTDSGQLVYSQGAIEATPRKFERISTLAIAGQSLTLGWDRGPNFVVHPHVDQVWLPASLAVITVLLTGWILSIQRLREQAESLVLQRTAELRESEERWKFALEGAGDGVWDLNLVDRTCYYSPRWKEMLGYTAEEIGTTEWEWSSRLHEEDKQPADEASRAYLSGRAREYICEHRLRCKDGTWKWVLGRGLVIRRDANGQPLRMIGTNVDITARKEAESRLRQSELHLRTVINAQPECVKIVSPEGHLLEMNPAGLAMLEVESVAEAEAHGLANFLLPPYREAFRSLHARVLAGGEGTLEYEIEGRRGGRRWLETRATALRSETDGSVNVLGVTRDITARKLAEAAIEKERAIADRYLWVAEVMLVAFDAHARITLINRKGHSILGYEEGELIGKDWFNTCLLPEERAGVVQAYHQILAGDLQPVEYFENFVLRKDGEKRLIAWHNSMVKDETGRIVGTLSSGEDITERRQAEREKAVEQEVLEIIARGGALPEIFHKFLVSYERLLPGTFGSILLLDETKRQLRHGAAPSLPAAYCAAIDGVTIGPDVGSCGTAAYTGRNVVVEDIAVDPKWSRFKDLALSHGLCACTSIPILDGRGAVLGTFAFYCTTPRKLKTQEILALERGAHLARLVIERDRADAALRASEERFQLVNRATFDVIWDQDLRTGVIWWSEHFQEIYGHAPGPAGVSGEFWRSCLHPEDLERVVRTVRATLESKDEIWADVYRFRRHDGTYAHVEDRAFVVRDASGQPIRLLGAMRDITERKQTEDELLLEGEMLQNVIDGINLTSATDGRILRTNRRFDEMFGYGPGELIGQSVEVLNAYDGAKSPESVAAEIIQSLRETGKWEGEVRNRRKDGSTFWCWASVSAFNHATLGKVWVTAQHDITLSREATEQLRQNELRLQLALQTAQIAVFEMDRDLRYTWIRSPSLGLTPAQVLGRTDEDLLGADGAAPLTSVKRQVLATGESVRKEVCIAWFGEDRHFQLIVEATRAPDGQGLGLRGSATDITALKRTAAEHDKLERKLLESQKLESLGVLAGGIAHDFNNLLTGILGNASLAALDLPGENPVQHYLDNIRQSSLRAADLCKQMLAYSGRGRFVIGPLSLNQLVEDTTHLLRISISKSAVLRLQLAPNLPAIEADGTQLRQVVMNLVINASEAIGEQTGVIRLSTGVMPVDAAFLKGALLAPDLPEGRYVFLEVADTGHGMSPDIQAKIFDPFFTTKFAGRGLGLAAVVGIVRGHKGAIHLHSAPGEGTTFRLVFPCVEGAAPPLPTGAAAAAPAWRGSGKLLVVDDEESVRTTAALTFERLGFTVQTAADGREAVERFQADPAGYRAVLMDLTMPRLNGEQAFDEMRRLKPDVRVILMSGYDEHEATARFTGRGLASFVQKPFEVGILVETLRRVLG